MAENESPKPPHTELADQALDASYDAANYENAMLYAQRAQAHALIAIAEKMPNPEAFEGLLWNSIIEARNAITEAAHNVAMTLNRRS